MYRVNIMEVAICIYTHSTYFDILKIHLDYANTLYKDSPYNIYIFSDIPYTSGGGMFKKGRSIVKRRRIKRMSKKQKGGQNNTQLKYKTILYDNNKPYFSRLIDCLQQVESDYIIITHDYDVVIRFNREIINPLVESMKTNNIDSIELLNKGKQAEISVYKTLSISKKEDDGYTYNVQPRLWRKKSALDIYSKFPNSPYATCEVGEIQEYIKNNQKTYTMSDTISVRSTRYYFYSPFFCFIHLTGGSKLIPCTKENNLEPFIQEEHEKIYNKYFKNSKREVDTKIWIGQLEFHEISK